MINRSVFCLDLTVNELKSLLAIKDWEGSMWDNPPNPEIEAVKTKIRGQLEPVQLNCAYCGLSLGGTSKGQIEHIAPKASYRYPQFTFTLRNLVLACNYCNGFDKKGTTDTIQALNRSYSRCVFRLVHPYFDDPNDHFEWDDNNLQVLISVRNGSVKGEYSIELFGLDSPKMSELRAQQVRFEELKQAHPISEADEQLIEEALRK